MPLEARMDFYAGKRIFITGGSSGIGLDAARLLSSYGAHIAIFASDRKKLLSSQKELERLRKSKEQTIYSLSMDVSDHADVDTKIKKAVGVFGIPDIVINGAEVRHADYFENITYETFNNVIMINLYGTRNVIAAVLPYMKGRGGHIVNVSSMAGLAHLFSLSAYCAAKAAVAGFSECLRPDLKRYNIHVSLYCLPDVDAPMKDSHPSASIPEPRPLVKTAQIMNTGKSAIILLKGIEKKKFLIIPGLRAKCQYINKIFFRLTRAIS